MNHNNLENYFKTNFSLVQHHKWSISDIEELMIFEKDIYVDLLIAYIKQKEEEARNAR